MTKYAIWYADYKSLENYLLPQRYEKLFDNEIEAFNFADKNFSLDYYATQVWEVEIEE